jgi:hypothetical protein
MIKHSLNCMVECLKIYSYKHNKNKIKKYRSSFMTDLKISIILSWVHTPMSSDYRRINLNVTFIINCMICLTKILLFKSDLSRIVIKGSLKFKSTNLILSISVNWSSWSRVCLEVCKFHWMLCSKLFVMSDPHSFYF